jgi:hypothetical protein
MSISTSIDGKIKLNTKDDEFQRFVGKLIYITITRSDNSFSISQINQFMHLP